MSKVVYYLKKFWWILVGIVLILLGFMLGRGKTASLEKWRETQEKIKSIEEQERKDLEEVKKNEEQSKREASQAHDVAKDELKEDKEKENDELRKDPDQLNSNLNDFLNRRRSR